MRVSAGAARALRGHRDGDAWTRRDRARDVRVVVRRTLALAC
jgi:hypothetical protein